jgi:RNA polymerase sigma-70 factor, ECF subfamily
VNLGLRSETFFAQGAADGALAPSAGLLNGVAPGGAASGCTKASPVTSAACAELSSEQLAEQSKKGCLGSFEQLVSRYEGQIFNFLRQFTGNHHDAEDLTQATFVKAFQSLHRFNSSLSFATWIFTIARRTAASHFRSTPRFEELPANEEGTPESPATALESKDERTSLWGLVRTLKPKQAEALWLRYAEGFSVAEVARIMGTNQIHIKVLLHRARTHLLTTLTGRGAVSNATTDLSAQIIK